MSKSIGYLEDKSGNSLYPYGIETITNGNGTALKFPDGTMIVAQKVTFTNISQNISWGSLYRTDYLTLPNYPVTFIDVKSKSVIANTSGNGWAMLNSGGNTSAGRLSIVQPNSNASVPSITVDVMAIGRWK